MSDSVKIPPPNLLTTYCLTDGPPKEQEYLVDGILPLNIVSLIVGAPKHKKTWLAHCIAIAVANMLLVLDKWQARKSGPVLIYSPEGGLQNLKRRLWGICWGQQLDPPTALKNILVLGDRVNLSSDKSLHALQATIEFHKPVLTVIDPLVSCHGAKENSSDEMQEILNRIRDLGNHSASMNTLLVHHMPKGGTSPRGSSAIDGFWDGKMEIGKNNGEDDTVQGITFDLRDGCPPPPIGFRLMTGVPEPELAAPKGLYKYSLVAEEYPGLGKSGRKLDIDVVLRVLELIQVHNGKITRSKGAVEMGMSRSQFNRYYDHLHEQGKVTLERQGTNEVMICV